MSFSNMGGLAILTCIFVHGVAEREESHPMRLCVDNEQYNILNHVDMQPVG